MTPADAAVILGIAALLILRELLPELARIREAGRAARRKHELAVAAIAIAKRGAE